MKLTFETLLLALGIVAVAAVFFVEAGTTNQKGTPIRKINGQIEVLKEAGEKAGSGCYPKHLF